MTDYKRQISARISDDAATLVGLLHINKTEVIRRAIDIEISVRLGSLDTDIDSLKDLALLKLEEEEQRKARLIIMRDGKRRETLEMVNHIEAAITAGKSRGEAETDFGSVFPDDLWQRCRRSANV